MIKKVQSKSVQRRVNIQKGKPMEEGVVDPKAKINKCPKCSHKGFDIIDYLVDDGYQILLELLCECYKCRTTWWANYTVKFDKIFNIVSEGETYEEAEDFRETY